MEYRVALRLSHDPKLPPLRRREIFSLTGSKAGIQPSHAGKLNLQLTSLNKAKIPEDMAVAGWNLHLLQGELKGYWSVKVNGNWRLTFRFEGEDAILVDYQDYH